MLTQIHSILLLDTCREFAEETMGLFGGCAVDGSSVAACSKQMHAQLTRRQHVLKVVHQLKKVGLYPITCKTVLVERTPYPAKCLHHMVAIPV